MSVLNCVQKKKAEQEIPASNKYHQKGPIFSHYENTTQDDFYFLIITCNSYYKTKVGFAFDSVWVENAVLSCEAGNALLTQKLAIRFRYSTQPTTPPHPQMPQVRSRYVLNACLPCSLSLQLLSYPLSYLILDTSCLIRYKRPMSEGGI